MTTFMNKLLKISQQSSFIKPVLQKKDVVSYFKYGPLGELLCQNIYNEWVISNVTCRDVPVFPFYTLNNSDNLIDGIKEQFLEAKNLCRNNLPFGITFSRLPKILTKIDDSLSKESKCFRPLKSTELKCIHFTTPEEGQQYFHFWLRQRKIWWRKFSADPGRFSLTEIKSDNNIEFTDIQAKFECGIEPVETIRYLPSTIFESLPEQDQELFRFKIKKKKVFPCVIESVSNLDIAAFCFLCDAFYEEIRLDSELPRQCIKLHRKLSPYKTAFAIDYKGGSQHEDLKDLAEYLSLNIKKAGIPALYVEQLCYSPAQEMFKYYDLLGIPYVIVLRPSTFKEGLFGLRSRETTLEEILHVDQLIHHMEMLLKNY